MTAPRFAAALSQHPVASQAVGEVAGEILERVRRRRARPARVLRLAALRRRVEDLASRSRNLLEPRVMLGATMVGVAGGAVEVEDGPGLSVFAARSRRRARRRSRSTRSARPTAPRSPAGPTSRRPGTLLLLADPFTFPVDDFLARLQRRPSRAPGDRRRGVGRRAARAATGSCSTTGSSTDGRGRRVRRRTSRSARSCRRAAARSARRSP